MEDDKKNQALVETEDKPEIAASNEPKDIIDSSYNKALDYQRHVLHEMINMVLRQTSYTYEEAWRELVKHKGNYMLVIRNDAGLGEKNTANDNPTRSVNQETYKQIRDYMDKGCEQFRRQREISEMVQNMKKQ